MRTRINFMSMQTALLKPVHSHEQHPHDSMQDELHEAGAGMELCAALRAAFLAILSARAFLSSPNGGQIQKPRHAGNNGYMCSHAS